MADLENKHVASLDFDIQKATQQLKDLTEIVNNLSNNTQKKFDGISKTIETSLGGAKLTQTITNQANLTNKAMNQIVVNAEKANQQRLSNAQKTANSSILIEQKSAAKIDEINAKKELSEQNYNQKRLLQEQKLQNQLTLETSKGIGDRIKEYAGMAIGITSVYQGFNLLRSAASDTIEEMKNVEYRMMEISRIMADGSIIVKDYRDDLIELAGQYGRSFDDISTATLNFARAGFNAQESLKLTEQAMLALNTAELDSEQATDGLIAVMAQWGLNTGNASEEAENLGAIIDKINKTADNFPIESKDILEALQRVSQGFALSGATIDETIAMIVAAEKESQRGGKIIGTAMSNMVQQLKSEGRLNLAEQLGLDFYKDEAQTEFKSVTEIFATMSERMKELKEAGKESSVEMQQLLELFTVFRRNIGAGLLSEMGGEDSTYMKALETSMNSLGYSAQENSKYMDTMTAKTQQFENTLLQLKTAVWDNGVENVFRDFLNLGSNVVQFITDLIDKFGLLPTAIGAVTLAYTAFNNQIKIQASTQGIGFSGELINKIKNAKKEIEALKSQTLLLGNSNIKASQSLTQYVQSVGVANASTKGYILSLASAKAAEVALQIATVALQATISLGLSLAITAIITAIQNWINSEQNAIDKTKELIDTSKEEANTYKDKADELDRLAKSYSDTYKEYEKLKNAKGDTGEQELKLIELQNQINEALDGSGSQVKIINEKIDEQGNKVQIVNDKYREQLSLVQSISYENKKKEAEELKSAVENQQKLFEQTYKSEIKSFGSMEKYYNALVEQYNQVAEEYTKEYYNMTDKQREATKELMETTSSRLNQIADDYSKVEQAAQDYNEVVNELYEFGISSVAQNYSAFLEKISNTYKDQSGPQELINNLQNINNSFLEGKINVEDYFKKIQSSIDDIDLKAFGDNFDLAKSKISDVSKTLVENSEEIESYQAIFAATTKSVAEGFEIIQGQFEAGQTTFQDYANSMEGAAQSTLDLYTQSNELTLENGKWVDVAGNVDSYANSLQNAVSNLESFNGILSTIDENQQFLSEHLNDFGQLALENTDLSSQAYQNFANSFINDLNVMREANASIFQDIVGTAEQAAGVTAGAFIDANGNIVSSIAGDANAMNALVNASTTSVGKALGELTTSAGNVITALGNVIKNFDYTINFIPSGSLHFDKINLLDAIKNGGDINFSGEGLHLNITGEGGGNVGDLGSALADFGGKLSNISPVVTNLGDILAAGRPRNVGGTGRDYKAPYTPTVTSPSGTGGSSGYSSSTTEKNTILQDFKDAISERESEEQRWVKKQKELNQLSLDDQKYLLQQEIERYKKYADEVMRLNGVTEEEKLKVRKEYLQKAEDLELDYFELLEDQLNEQIKAIQEKYDERIDKINEAADAEIEALKKVEDENDRIREKEEYQRRRDEIIHGHQGIEYWEQRTGREAQLALAEARKELEDLDRDWAEKQESWTTEDQIAAIEARRDADIEAAQQQMDAEIAAIQATYDYRVKLFAETGQIIYDEAVLQSKALYDTYKKNFIDPVGSELQKALSQQASTNTVSNSTRDYVIQWGDTLTGIANRFGTTIQKLMQANPFIVDPNRIYAGQTLKIPQAHTGKKVLKDGMVELQAGEVVLNTKWARDLDRMLSNYSNNTNNNTVNNNGNTVNVRGDMMKIEATIEDKSDVNTLARKIKKTIESQFSIR